MKKNSMKNIKLNPHIFLVRCAALILSLLLPYERVLVAAPGDIMAARKLDGPRVAANPEDKWVLFSDIYIYVITKDGRVFAHQLSNGIQPAVLLPGPKVAANPQDKKVLLMGSKIVVITTSGKAFAHDIQLIGPSPGTIGYSHPKSIGEAYALSGSEVAGRPEDKWIVNDGDRIIVIKADGSVFAHKVTNNKVNAPSKLSGPRVAANPDDKWVLIGAGAIDVITRSGSVFRHQITGDTISPAKQVPSPAVAARPEDKWVGFLPGGIAVITSAGGVFFHPIESNPVH